MKYRADIDGLRALAVIPVILFHAGFELFSGGFVGVDVFFVICGDVITKILIEDIEKKRFSIANFYERRARRILPALFFVMLLCIPFAWMWMLPSQMADFARSLVAVSLFASNILFWRQSGYFSAAAEENPLLHTWSLAVEEQYYVIFPIFLFLVWGLGKKNVFLVIAILAAMSLLLSEWASRNFATANFYLAPTRAWELFAGSIAAFVVQKRGVRKNNALSLSGLAAIVIAIFAYDHSTPFPGLYALLPVFGVVLLVLYGHPDTWAARLLGVKLFVGLGLISYSAYLWHQPLFAFARIRLAEPSLAAMTVLSLLALGLAYMSWRFVERPFRRRDVVSRKSIVVVSLAGFLSMVTAGLTGQVLQGNLGRWNADVVEYLELKQRSNAYVWREINRLRHAKFDQDKWKVLVIGDSNSGDTINSLRTLRGIEDVSLSALIVNAGCGPVFVPFGEYEELIDPQRMDVCKRADYLLDQRSISLIKQADVVIFASSWVLWHVDFVERSQHVLTDRFGDKFWWIGNKYLDFPEEGGLVVDRSLAFDNFYPVREDDRIINSELKDILGDRFIDPYGFLCTKGTCMAKDMQGRILMYDGFHLTHQGARYFGEKLEEHHFLSVSTWLNR